MSPVRNLEDAALPIRQCPSFVGCDRSRRPVPRIIGQGLDHQAPQIGSHGVFRSGLYV